MTKLYPQMKPSETNLNISKLVLGENYTRNEVADTCGIARPNQPRDWPGVVAFENLNLLFVTLDKSEHSHDYQDFFDEEGTLFHWDSQNRNTTETGFIKEMIEESREVHLLVSHRAKVKSKTAPFTYAGQLSPVDYDGNKPVSFLFDVLDYSPALPSLRELYQNQPPIDKIPERKKQLKTKRKQNSKPSIGYYRRINSVNRFHWNAYNGTNKHRNGINTCCI